MTTIIYDRASAREAMIWRPFQHNGPFAPDQETERSILFGLYANTYLHGHSYLREIEAEDLSRLVDTYTVNMAMLTNEEARVVLEIAARRYVETITNQIHREDMTTKRRKIDALDDEYDARMEALDADYAALETQRQKVQLAWDKAAQRVKELEARTRIEEVNQDLVDVDIAEQELKAARADLEILDAGLKGLDIQLAITRTGIDITNTELQIAEAENEVEEIGIRISETEVQEAGVDLDIVNAGVNLSKAVSEGMHTQARTKGVAVDVAETGIRITETEARAHEYTADIAKINSDKARLGLVGSELEVIKAQKDIAAAENELVIQEGRMVQARQDNVRSETAYVANHQAVQEALDANQLAYDLTEHDANMDNITSETNFENNLKEIRVGALDAKKELADKVRETKTEDAVDRTELDKIRAEAAEEYASAAISAAQEMANADIVNTLEHSVG